MLLKTKHKIIEFFRSGTVSLPFQIQVDIFVFVLSYTEVALVIQQSMKGFHKSVLSIYTLGI